MPRFSKKTHRNMAPIVTRTTASPFADSVWLIAGSVACEVVIQDNPASLRTSMQGPLSGSIVDLLGKSITAVLGKEHVFRRQSRVKVPFPTVVYRRFAHRVLCTFRTGKRSTRISVEQEFRALPGLHRCNTSVSSVRMPKQHSIQTTPSE